MQNRQPVSTFAPAAHLGADQSNMFARIAGKRMPQHIQLALAYYLTGVGDTLPPNLQTQYCGSTIHMLDGARWLGGGTDGCVFELEGPHRPVAANQSANRLQASRATEDTSMRGRVLKVREISCEQDKLAALREVCSGALLRAARVPFVVHIYRWNLWRGERSGIVSNSLSKQITLQLNRPNGQVFEFFETLPRQLRDQAYEHWCNSYAPGFRQRKDRSIKHLHEQYAKMRTQYLSNRLKPGRAQLYMTMEMPLMGSRTLQTAMFSRDVEANERLCAPRQWPQCRAIMIAVCHILYALQQRYRFMHGDLNLANISLEQVEQLPVDMRDMWMPVDTRHASDPQNQNQNQTRPLDLGALNGHVPRLIDISLATVDYRRVVCPTLDILPGGSSEPAAKYLLDRTMRFEPTADTRRMGLLMAWGVLDAFLTLSEKTGSKDDELLHDLRATLDWRFVLFVTGLTTPAASWLDLCTREPDLTTRRFEHNPLMPAQPFSATFAEFVEKYSVLQRGMRGILHLVRGPPNDHHVTPRSPQARDSRRREHQLLWAVKSTAPKTIETVLNLIRDLNPHLDYAVRVCGLQTYDDDPLLPHNILRWIPQSANTSFFTKILKS